MIKVVTHLEELKAIAHCHAICFPKSRSTNLGKKYIEKTFEWYLLQSNRKLIYIELDGKVAGYCGYFFHVNEDSGSTTGMFQHAFKTAIKSLILKPWVLLNLNINTSTMRFMVKQLYLKVLKTLTKKENKILTKTQEVKTCGLVVIGVNPEFQGSGVSDNLLSFFKNDIIKEGCSYGILSVNPTNSRAINFYKKNNWTIKHQTLNTIVMHLNTK